MSHSAKLDRRTFALALTATAAAGATSNPAKAADSETPILRLFRQYQAMTALPAPEPGATDDDRNNGLPAESIPTPDAPMLAAFAGWRSAWESVGDLLDIEDGQIEDLGPHDVAMLALEPKTIEDLWLQVATALACQVAPTDPAPAGVLLRRALVEVERITGEPLKGI